MKILKIRVYDNRGRERFLSVGQTAPAGWFRDGQPPVELTEPATVVEFLDEGNPYDEDSRGAVCLRLVTASETVRAAEAAAEAAEAEAAAEVCQPEQKAEVAERKAAEETATAGRREAGARLKSLSGAPSGHYFGTYSGRGEMVACPKGQPEIVVARRVDSTTGESAAEFGKYVAWGCPLESHTVSHWEATPDGERLLAEYLAREERIEIARSKAAQLRKAREARERAAAVEARKATRLSCVPAPVVQPQFNTPFANLAL